ncbi:MAG: hypothetical protein M3O80_09665, partial [Chloroflexota bacterium]|nr:hypothetical protein [Chloroflexota bacterium]
ETGAGTTDLANYDSVIGGDCLANGEVTLAAGASKSCTITNTRKPVLTVVKACPDGKQSPGDRFEVVLNGTRTGRILDCGQSTTFMLKKGDRIVVTEAVPAGNTTTNLSNYRITYSADCVNSTGLAAGATPTCTITNARTTPRNQPFTPGYWKNHPTQAGALLPVTLGTFSVKDVKTLNAVFSGMNCSGTKDLDAVGCLAGHLLAAKLNVKNGADNCINAIIAQADAFLTSIGYQGPGKPLAHKLTAAERATAISLKDALDTYDNGGGCA